MFLVTTPLTPWEESDQLLLGPWCKKQARTTGQLTVHEMSHPLVPLEQKKRCNRESRELVQSVMPDLFRELNSLHGTSHGSHFWKVVCQRWLLGFVDVIYQRWHLIDRALREFDVDKAGGISVRDEVIASRTTQEFNLQREDHSWNEHIFSAIMGFRGVPIAEATAQVIQPAYVSGEMTNRTRYFGRLFGALIHRSPICVVDSYLPRHKELFLAMRMRSFPMRLNRHLISEEPYSKAMRASMMLSRNSSNPLECFLRENLTRWIPMAWVEDFKNLTDPKNANIFPRSPRTIFTANAHLSNDHFMIWAASRLESGSRLVFSQHGGLYGEGEVRSRNEEHELDVADKYVTWGWRDAESPNIETTRSQLATNPRKSCNSVGGLLFVMDTTFRYSRYSWETRAERDLYLESSSSLVSHLPQFIREKTVVRLHHDHDRYDDGHQSYFGGIPDIKMDDYSKPITQAIKVSRLVLVTTLSTTFIENIWSNTPTMIYAHPSIYEIRTEFRDVFEELTSVGVFHESHNTAAEFVGQIWDSVETWWESDGVKQAVKRYGEMFAGLNTHGRRSLVNVIRAASSVPNLASKY